MTSTTRYLQESRLTERRAVDADAAFARRLVLISFLGWLIAMTLIWGRDHALSSLRRDRSSARRLHVRALRRGRVPLRPLRQAAPPRPGALRCLRSRGSVKPQGKGGLPTPCTLSRWSCICRTRGTAGDKYNSHRDGSGKGHRPCPAVGDTSKGRGEDPMPSRRILARVSKHDPNAPRHIATDNAPRLPGLDERISLRSAATLLHVRASVERLAAFGLKPIDSVSTGTLTFTAYDRAQVLAAVKKIETARAARIAAATSGPAAVANGVAAAVAESGMPPPVQDATTLARQQFAVSCEIRDLLKSLVASQGKAA